nr:hypothetical protein [uncultured Holophaga sp.]
MRSLSFVALTLLVAPLAQAAPAHVSASAPDPSAQAARQSLQRVLDAVDGAWFGRAYQGRNAVQVSGSMNLVLSAAAVNNKAAQLTQGQLKGVAAKGGKVAMQLKGTYFANGDFRTETAGDFGQLVYTRVGNRGFLYSKEQNAYTTAVDLPAPDSPTTYMGWFRSVLQDIRSAYIDAPTFKASLGKAEVAGGRNLETVVFTAPSGKYDASRREQSMKETLGFWKRGRLTVSFDKATHLPYRMTFSNEKQGVESSMSFSYLDSGRLQSVEIANRSRGMEGPGNLRINYGGDGLMSHISGHLSGKQVGWSFDLGLEWVQGLSSASIHSAPPAGATKKGGEEFQVALLVGTASEIFDLQRNGLNLLAPKMSGH